MVPVLEDPYGGRLHTSVRNAFMRDVQRICSLNAFSLRCSTERNEQRRNVPMLQVVCTGLESYTRPLSANASLCSCRLQAKIGEFR